jgi:hypothetical protein
VHLGDPPRTRELGMSEIYAGEGVRIFERRRGAYSAPSTRGHSSRSRAALAAALVPKRHGPVLAEEAGVKPEVVVYLGNGATFCSASTGAAG